MEESSRAAAETSIRVFAAMPAPEEAVRLVETLSQQIQYRGWKWMRPHNLHLTTYFIGNIPVEALPEIGKAIGEASVDVKAFEIFSEGLVPMPSRRPRMLWWRFARCKEFSALHEALKKACEPFVRTKDRTPQDPWPHITLARFHGCKITVLPSLDITPSLTKLCVREFQIWQSVLLNGRTDYTVTPWHYTLSQ
ncbi:MAG: RNA 2',3'-cyclic phosphodiesterase [Flavobacteriales bacterium]|nr:RNA 2',3'-cyclic phosphodiesterase [Flavobacteriales bacterium]MDW8409502.1 RNA 2',3'-cyclic phosphodiesterase [Flavobacteriales bacterium]